MSAGAEAGDDEHGEQVHRREREDRPEVVAADEPGDRAPVVAAVRRSGGPPQEPPEDQQVDRRQQHERGQEPGDDDPVLRRHRGQRHQQRDLADAVEAVLERHPHGLPHAREHRVLQGEHAPHHDGRAERERQDPALPEHHGHAERQVGGGDVQGAHQRARPGRHAVGEQREAGGVRARAGEEAGERVRDRRLPGEPGEELHHGDRGGAQPDVHGGVGAGGDDPVQEAEQRGDADVHQQRVAVAEERVLQVGAQPAQGRARPADR